MKKIFLLSSLFLVSVFAKGQYCLPSFTNSCLISGSSDHIENVSTTGGFSNISNLASGCSGGQGNYSFVPQTVSQLQGGSITLTMQCGAAYSEAFGVWVDWNQDLVFQASEFVYASPNAATTPFTTTITVPATATPGYTTMRIMCKYASVLVAANACQTTFAFGETEDYYFQVISPTPCNSTPTAGTIYPSGTTYLCPSSTLNISTQGSSALAGMQYQWQTAPISGTPWTNIAGATNPYYVLPAATPSALYRMIILCSNTYQKDTSDVDTVILQSPNYATIPYTQSFENWFSYCSSNDVPVGYNWKNSPIFGNNSWRRDDQGSFGSWGALYGGAYAPPASIGSHSARFHSYYTSDTGKLDLYLDLSSQPGTKTLFFDYMNVDGTDSLYIDFSTDGGLTYNTIQGYDTTSYWQTYGLNLSSNSSTCILRFRAIGDYGYSTDIGIDNIKVYPPCSGMPFAGIINDTGVCKGALFNVTTNGSSAVGGLNYVWQSAPSTTGPWTTLGSTITPFIQTSILDTTYFRAIVTCLSSALSDTTQVAKFKLNDFYFCYCGTSVSNTSNYINIGNVNVKKATPINTVLFNNLPIAATDTLNNTSTMYPYTSYALSLPIPTIYLDSIYNVKVTDITPNSYNVYASTVIYIDYNRDGIFDPITEAVTGGTNNISGSTTIPTNTMTGSFIVPNNLSVNPTNNPALSAINIVNTGITGMRVVTSDVGAPSSISPCGSIYAGEVEDYLVKISLPPCVAPSYAGTANISDTLLCPGYNVTISDITHSNVYNYMGYATQWQDSIAGSGIWANVPGGTTDTIVYNVSTQTSFRYRIICSGTDTAYSNIVSVHMKPAFTCYPPSEAVGGGILDSTDNGAFTIGNYSYMSPGGGHLRNASATRARTDYTNAGIIVLYNDSTYKVSVYDIMKSFNHHDARVTLFIDYNNDNLYNIPSERVFTGTSDASSYYLPFTIHTPINPVMNVLTGMRLVVNNDVSPNNASDLGVGTYISGETEDYIVKFIQKPTAIVDILNFENVNVYPNPSTGLVFVDINVSEVKDVNITVTNITGAEVYKQEVGKVNGRYNTSMNLNKLARGTYMVKVQGDKGSVVRRVVLQ